MLLLRFLFWVFVWSKSYQFPQITLCIRICILGHSRRKWKEIYVSNANVWSVNPGWERMICYCVLYCVFCMRIHVGKRIIFYKGENKKKKGNRLSNGTWQMAHTIGKLCYCISSIDLEFGIPAKMRTIFSNNKSIVILFTVIQSQLLWGGFKANSRRQHTTFIHFHSFYELRMT